MGWSEETTVKIITMHLSLTVLGILLKFVDNFFFAQHHFISLMLHQLQIVDPYDSIKWERKQPLTADFSGIAQNYYF